MKKDVVEAFIGQMEDLEDHKSNEQSSNIKMVRHANKQSLKRSHHACKFKPEAHNCVNREFLKENFSTMDKRKHSSRKLKKNKSCLETSVGIDSEKKMRETERRKLRRAKKKVLSVIVEISCSALC